MLLFKTENDLLQLPKDDPAYPIMEDLVERLIVNFPGHIPDDHGFLALVQPGDTDRVLDEIWDDWTLLDIPWEGITLRDGFFYAVFLANNEFGIVFLIPDAPWVNGKLRAEINRNLDD